MSLVSLQIVVHVPAIRRSWGWGGTKGGMGNKEEEGKAEEGFCKDSYMVSGIIHIRFA